MTLSIGSREDLRKLIFGIRSFFWETIFSRYLLLALFTQRAAPI